MEQLRLSPTATLQLFETNKQDRKSFIESTISAIENGEISPLKVHLQIKAMEDIITSITSLDDKKNKQNIDLAKRYRKSLMDEAELHGKSFELHNAKFSISEVATQYDYSGCNDSLLNSLIGEIEELKLSLSNRQKFLQNIPEEGLQQVTEEGEVVTLYRPIKTSTTALKVSLK